MGFTQVYLKLEFTGQSQFKSCSSNHNYKKGKTPVLHKMFPKLGLPACCTKGCLPDIQVLNTAIFL